MAICRGHGKALSVPSKCGYLQGYMRNKQLLQVLYVPWVEFDNHSSVQLVAAFTKEFLLAPPIERFDSVLGNESVCPTFTATVVRLVTCCNWIQSDSSCTFTCQCTETLRPLTMHLRSWLRNSPFRCTGEVEQSAVAHFQLVPGVCETTKFHFLRELRAISSHGVWTSAIFSFHKQNVYVTNRRTRITFCPLIWLSTPGNRYRDSYTTASRFLMQIQSLSRPHHRKIRWTQNKIYESSNTRRVGLLSRKYTVCVSSESLGILEWISFSISRAPPKDSRCIDDLLVLHLQKRRLRFAE
jgi:hypothetical protein